MKISPLILLWLIPGLFLSLTLNAETNPDPALADALQKAQELGMRVIIIDPTVDTGVADSPAQAREAVNDFKDDASLMSSTLYSAEKFELKLDELLTKVPSMFDLAMDRLTLLSPTSDPSLFLKLIFIPMGLLLVGAVFSHFVYGKRFARPWFESKLQDNPNGLIEKLPILTLRAILSFGGTLVTLLTAFVLGRILFGQATGGPPVKMTLASVYLAFASIQVAIAMWRLILAPYLSNYRIPVFSDHDAQRLFIWLSVGVAYGTITSYICFWIEKLGLGTQLHTLVTVIVSFLAVVLSAALVIANHKAITNAIVQGKPFLQCSIPERLVARFWAPFVVLYFIFAWFQMTYLLVVGEEPVRSLINGAYTILMTILIVYGLVGYAIERVFARKNIIDTMRAESAAAGLDGPAEGMEDSSPGQLDSGHGGDAADKASARIQTLDNFEDLIWRIAGILAMAAGCWALLNIWGVQDKIIPDNWLDKLIDISVILFIGYIAYHSVRIWIDRIINEEVGDQADTAEPGDEGGKGGASRLATLLPLFRNFLLIVIALSVLLIVLMELGINVGPLFAGAGVVGLAVGFGAQTLVRDVFSGAFFLLDDAFRKGEYIDIGSVKGTVEKISVRSFQLRHHLGPLHTVPFGEIHSLTNYSRDWVIMKLKLRVTYDTDVERVRKLIKKLGQELLKDPEIGSDFLQPLKSQGVIEMQDSAMIIRVKFMTKPGDQWMIRKRVYQEIRELFQRENIHFAHREVTVRVAGSNEETLSANQKELIGAAASQAIDDELPNQNPAGDDR